MKCADCPYYWITQGEDYPECHADRNWPAPCELEEDEDPFHENDPYTVTNPMAFY